MFVRRNVILSCNVRCESNGIGKGEEEGMVIMNGGCVLSGRGQRQKVDTLLMMANGGTHPRYVTQQYARANSDVGAYNNPADTSYHSTYRFALSRCCSFRKVAQKC